MMHYYFWNSFYKNYKTLVDYVVTVITFYYSSKSIPTENLSHILSAI